MAYIFGKEDFETGALPCSFDSTTSNGTGSITIDSTSKVAGVDSIALARSNAGGSYAIKDIGAEYSDIYFQFRIFLPNAWSMSPATYVGLFEFFDTGSAHEVLWGNVESAGGMLTINNATLGWTDVSINLTPNAVHRVEIRMKSGASGVVQIWVDNDTEGSPNYNSGVKNTGSYSTRMLSFGDIYSDNGHGTFYMDDCIMSASFIGSGSAPATPRTGTPGNAFRYVTVGNGMSRNEGAL